MRTLSIFRTLFFAGFVIAATGCNKEDSSPLEASTPDDIRALATGDVFKYNFYITDHHGTVKEGHSHIQIDSVTQTGISFMDRSDVFEIKQTRLNGYRKFRQMRYEDNGDVSVFFDGEELPVCKWITIPYGSRKEETQVFIDTTIGDWGGITKVYRGKLRWDNARNETLRIDGRLITCQAYRGVAHIAITANGEPYAMIDDEITYWFAPELGYFAKIEDFTKMSGPTIKTSPSIFHYDLSSFSLK